MQPRLPKTVLTAIGALAVALVTFHPRTTEAEEITDAERSGEIDEDGQRFGDVVVSAKLVADPKAPGGWVLVRTYQNKGDAPCVATLEERVLQTRTMEGSRVDPPPTAVMVRTQRFALAPHEKRAIGVYLPASVAAEIGAAEKRRAAVQAAIAREYTSASPRAAVFEQTYATYHVDYLTPLPPGATAAKVEGGVTAPARMPGLLPSGAGNALARML